MVYRENIFGKGRHLSNGVNSCDITRDPHNFEKAIRADTLPTWTERDTGNMKSKKVVGP